MTHSLHSPDLTPSDYFLFGSLSPKFFLPRSAQNEDDKIYFKKRPHDKSENFYDARN
jgi:hypothetical protein